MVAVVAKCYFPVVSPRMVVQVAYACLRAAHAVVLEGVYVLAWAVLKVVVILAATCVSRQAVWLAESEVR